jgi:hypothetical protein
MEFKFRYALEKYDNEIVKLYDNKCIIIKILMQNDSNFYVFYLKVLVNKVDNNYNYLEAKNKIILFMTNLLNQIKKLKSKESEVIEFETDGTCMTINNFKIINNFTETYVMQLQFFKIDFYKNDLNNLENIIKNIINDMDKINMDNEQVILKIKI